MKVTKEYLKTLILEELQEMGKPQAPAPTVEKESDGSTTVTFAVGKEKVIINVPPLKTGGSPMYRVTGVLDDRFDDDYNALRRFLDPYFAQARSLAEKAHGSGIEVSESEEPKPTPSVAKPGPQPKPKPRFKPKGNDDSWHDDVGYREDDIERGDRDRTYYENKRRIK